MDHELMTMWLSVDPMADKYPSISPYAYCAWNPVRLVDPDGCEVWILINEYSSNPQRIKWTTDGLFNEDGTKYTGNDKFAMETAMALNAIYADDDSRVLLSQFMGNSEFNMIISEYNNTEYNELTSGNEEYGMPLKKDQLMFFNTTLGLSQCKPEAENEEYLAPFVCLLHEFGHAYNAVTDNKGYHERKDKRDDQYGNLEERFVIQMYEYPLSAKYGMLQRTSHKVNYLGLDIINTSGVMSSKPLN